MVLPSNNSLIRKIGTNKTQVFHQMRLRQFTSRQPIPDVQFMPRVWKSDPEVIIKHDDLNARARECEYEKSIFDSKYYSLVTSTSPWITVRSDGAADETSTTPETIRETSPERFTPDSRMV